MLPRASRAPHCARWLARVACFRTTALALSSDEVQHVRFRRARAPRRVGDTRSTHHGRALHEREAAVPSAPARVPTCQPCPSLREVACACNALARLCARSLWGQGAARALPTRARRAALATLAPCTVEGHCTSKKPPFLRRHAFAPTCHRASSARSRRCSWNARCSCACHCSGRGLDNGPRAYCPPAELRTCDQCHLLATGASRALDWFSAVPLCRCASRASSARSRRKSSLHLARE